MTTINGKIDRRALPEPDLANLANEYVAPVTEAEKIICAEFARVLETEQIGMDDDFFKLGGNSIKAIRLISRLKDNFQIEVANVFKFKTPAAIVKNVAFIKDGLKHKLEKLKSIYAKSKRKVALRSNLQDKLAKYAEDAKSFNFVPDKKTIRSVLLTGGTGYLGSNLIRQLLLETPYNIYLLIRAESDTDALQRVTAKYNYYFDTNLNDYAGRIVALAANIEEPTLGLSEKVYRDLVDNIDSIIHSAALVKHYGQYNDFYKANVQTTINLLELAKITQGKDFNYVSTYSVLDDGYIENTEHWIFDESDDRRIMLGGNNVYIKTKYEGEVITIDYRKHGITSNIFRVGNLSMISTNARNQENIEDNGFFTSIKTMLNLGIIAEQVAVSEVSPVDITALSIVKIFEQTNLSNQTYHVYNPNICNLAELLCQDKMLNLHQVSINEFIDSMMNKLNLTTYRKLIELFMLHQGWLQENKEGQLTSFEFKNTKTVNILEKLGVIWPVIDLTMLSDIIEKAFGERIAFLSTHMLSQDLSLQTRLNIAKQLALTHYNKDQPLQIEGVVSYNLKFIIKGFIDNYVKSHGGWIGSLHLLSEGDVINFESLAKLPSFAFYEAVFDDVSTLEISADIFNSLIVENPILYRKVFEKLMLDKHLVQQMYACLR